MRDTITGFIIPKTETEHDIHFISRLLTLLERERGYDDGRFLLAPMIEGVRAVTHIRDISISSSRIAAICFGGYDFRNDIKVISGSNPLFQLVPRALIAIAARSADVLPIDTPYFNIDDPDGLIAEKEEAAALGFAGSMVITPRHIETVNRCFSPSDENIAYARGVLCALDNAAASNSSYAKYDGLMIDAPIKSLAEYIMLYADIVNRKSTEVINGRTA
jgi:citrate lyase beta subunit